MPDMFTGTLAGEWPVKQFGYLAMVVASMCMMTFLLYGIYLLLYLYSSYILIHRGLSFHRASTFLFAVTTVMFIFVTIYNLINALFTLLGLKSLSVVIPEGSSDLQDILLDAPLPITGTRLAELRTACAGFVFMFGDAIVIWRVWALWPERRYVVLLPCSFFLGTCVTTLLSMGLDVNPLNISSVIINNISIASWVLSFATNLSSTLLIGWKAWMFRDVILHQAGFSVGSIGRNKYSANSSVYHIFMVLIESGCLYSMLWAIIIMSEYIRLPWRLLPKLTHATIFTLPLAVQLAGIYPTLIIILVSLRQSMDFTISTVSVPPSGPSVDPTLTSRPSALTEIQFRDNQNSTIQEQNRFMISTPAGVGSQASGSSSDLAFSCEGVAARTVGKVDV